MPCPCILCVRVGLGLVNDGIAWRLMDLLKEKYGQHAPGKMRVSLNLYSVLLDFLTGPSLREYRALAPNSGAPWCHSPVEPSPRRLWCSDNPEWQTRAYFQVTLPSRQRRLRAVSTVKQAGPISGRAPESAVARKTSIHTPPPGVPGAQGNAEWRSGILLVMRARF